MTSGSSTTTHDVVIIGGALSGGAAALLLKRENPALRVVVVEKDAVLDRRVGESTVDISGYFLGKVLGLTHYLNEHHLVKQGLRFWFHNGQTTGLADSAEVGGGYNSRLSTFQVDRATLDEEVLRRAAALGVELLRPARVTRVELRSGGTQTVEVSPASGEPRTLTARWVVDASGVSAFIARKNGWIKRNDEHPIASVWSRYKGVKDWDDRELRRRFPAYGARAHGTRNTATNHLVGDGWWAWMIPLKGGDVSVGIVYDERLFKLPPGPDMAARLRTVLDSHPVGREMMADARHDPSDVHYRANLAYLSDKITGDGVALVGDAAAFLDPFYSPGMDWVTFTVYACTRLILRERAGLMKPGDAEATSERLRLGYRRLFEAIYKDKYRYMGDFELFSKSFPLDVLGYYIGVVSRPYLEGEHLLENPPFTDGPAAERAFRFIRAYNRRFVAMADHRRRSDTWGRANHSGRFSAFNNPTLCEVKKRFGSAYADYLKLELREGWRSWLAPRVEGPAA